MITPNGHWDDAKSINGQKYTCGYCGTETTSRGGYTYREKNVSYGGFFVNGMYILICTNCNQPTYIYEKYGIQVPVPNIKETIENLPEALDRLYNETRKAFSSGLYNATVLLCRKMLMNLAVQEGAEENKNFAFYVDYMQSNGYITPKMKPWVDEIRKIGNTATHEIPDVSKDEAISAFEFLVMLLKIIYEFPSKMGSK